MQTTEIRFELPRDELSVLDGYCQASGLDRTKVIRGLLRDWSADKLHEAIMVCRVAGINPIASDANRIAKQALAS